MYGARRTRIKPLLRQLKLALAALAAVAGHPAAWLATRLVALEAFEALALEAAPTPTPAAPERERSAGAAGGARSGLLLPPPRPPCMHRGRARPRPGGGAPPWVLINHSKNKSIMKFRLGVPCRPRRAPFRHGRHVRPGRGPGLRGSRLDRKGRKGGVTQRSIPMSRDSSCARLELGLPHRCALL